MQTKWFQSILAITNGQNIELFLSTKGPLFD